MKRATFISIIAFFLCYLNSYAQENIIQLNLKEGENYLFEQITTYSEFDNSGNQFVESVSEEKIKFYIEEVNDERIVFSSVVISGKSEDPDAEITTIHNIKFPPQYNNTDIIASQYNLVKSLLSIVELKFEIDLIQNTIIQINSTEMLDEMVSILSEKGFSKTAISSVSEFIQEKNDEAFRQMTDYNNFLLYTNHAIVNEHEELISRYRNKRFSKDKNGLYTSGQQVQLPGEQYSELLVDETHGFVSEFYEVKYDSIKSLSNRFNRSLKSIESEFSFIDMYKEGKELFTFNCTIENPADSVITLFYLDKPYGEEHTTRFLKLDKKNTASVQFDLPAQSFIYLSLREISYNHNYADYIFYAEPSDTLNINVLNENNANSLNISGNNELLNNAIYELEKEKKLFFPIYKRIQTERSTTNFIEFEYAEEAIELFDYYFREIDIKPGESGYNFIKNELRAAQYLNYYSILNIKYYIKDNNENNDKLIKARNMIERFDIHDIYNDYGIFSRQLSDRYFHYYLYNLTRVKNLVIHPRKSVSDDFETAKMILGGALFYRVMAERIIMSMTKKSSMFSSRSTFELQEAVALLNNLNNYSFDNYFNSSLLEFVNTRMNWEAESFIPGIQFFRPNGSKIQIENLIRDKPVVIYVSNNWSSFRYNFDKIAEAYPDILFVMIMEGNDLKKWQDYLKKVEPVAEQLLLIDDELSLDDIFSRSNELYIAYDKNGNLLGYDISGEQAIDRTKESLTDKKELDKSQLQFIVLFLAIALIALATGFFIWKWRARQRFRKEQQQRRLRELELTAIRSQMNPHFLFNCLNSVQNLVQQNKGREAHLYLADFAGLIRKVLNNSEKEEVSLAEELDMVQQYLNLEKLRFDFDYRMNVDEGVDIHNSLVPSMLLQPLAENAVIHGLQNKEGEKHLEIDVRNNCLAEDGSKEIVISIEDNGVGRAEAQKSANGSNGKGIKLIRERLAILQLQQKEKYRLQTTDLNDNGTTGTKVEIFVPEEN